MKTPEQMAEEYGTGSESVQPIGCRSSGSHSITRNISDSKIASLDGWSYQREDSKSR